MRCWHRALIPFLPRLQLISQWRECCSIAKSIAEKGTPNHILVNRIMDYPIDHFEKYTDKVVSELYDRGYFISESAYRRFMNNIQKIQLKDDKYDGGSYIFGGWHNDTYLRQCLYNLEEKAICGGISAEEWSIIYEAFKDFTPLWKE